MTSLMMRRGFPNPPKLVMKQSVSLTHIPLHTMIHNSFPVHFIELQSMLKKVAIYWSVHSSCESDLTVWAMHSQDWQN